MYFDLRCNSMEKSEVLRYIALVIHDLHGNKVFVGLWGGFICLMNSPHDSREALIPSKRLPIHKMGVQNFFLKVFGFSNLFSKKV